MEKEVGNYKDGKKHDKLDQKIRNVKIRTIWDVMKRWTEISYTARIQHLMDEFHLSYKRIEAIIKEEEWKVWGGLAFLLWKRWVIRQALLRYQT